MTLCIIHGLLDVISGITQGVSEVTSSSCGHTFAKQMKSLALFKFDKSWSSEECKARKSLDKMLVGSNGLKG